IATARYWGGDLEGARRAFAGAKTTVANGGDAYPKMIRLYRAIAQAEAKVGDQGASQQTFILATSLIASIDEASDRDRAYEVMAQDQAVSGDVTGAKATVAKIQDETRRAWAYGAVAEAEAIRGDFAGAAATAAEIKDKLQEGNTLLEVAIARALTG